VTAPLDFLDIPPAIVTDAACDIPPAWFEQYGIQVAPLKILFGDEIFRSGIDITHAEFYDRLAHGGVHPTTTQPTANDFVEIYTRLLEQKVPVLSIHISEGLSGTANVARMAAKQMPPGAVTVWGTGTLSSAQGLQVITAARAAQKGYRIDAILPLLKATHEQADLFFTVGDLTYLHRGGRIGSVRYQIGQVLHIKPIITVSKEGETAGTYISKGRARSMSKAIDQFVSYIAEAVGEGNKLRAISLYGDDPTLAEQLNAELAQHFDCVTLEKVPTAPVLGVHTGPDALGVSFIGGDWPA
jgi:DegV family protein with EDD domain